MKTSAPSDARIFPESNARTRLLGLCEHADLYRVRTVIVVRLALHLDSHVISEASRVSG